MIPPRPRTSWWPVIFSTYVQTLVFDANVAVEDVIWRCFVGVFVEDVS